MTDNNPQGNVTTAASESDADELLDRVLDDGDAGDQQPEQETDETPEQDAASESDEEDQPEQEEGEQAADTYADDTHKVKLSDGSEVTVAELKAGSLRQADYTRKTMEVSAARREIEQRQADIAQRAQAYEQQVNLALEIVAASLPQEPDTALLASDPVGYMQHKAFYDRRVGELQQLMAAKQNHEQAQRNQQQESLKTYVAGEMQLLQTAMPELSDAGKRQAFSTDLANAIGKYGFSEKDLANVYDHRLYLLGRDLIAYQKLMANKPQALAKTKGKPAMTPQGRKSPQAQRQQARQADLAKLRETRGKDEAVVDRILDAFV
jgi:hypothetical protein